MKKQQLTATQARARYVSYIVGFVLSLFTTLAAFFLVMNELWPKEMLVYILLGIAVLQLTVQMVFFLHLGQGNRWKSITFWFTILMVLIIAIGTIWIMHNMNYNMMNMTPEQMMQFMDRSQGF